MAKRENDPRLQKLFDEKKNVYSISKLNCIDQCLYQAYCTYILKDRGLNNCYGIMGSKIHDVLEAIINGDATEKELTPADFNNTEGFSAEEQFAAVNKVTGILLNIYMRRQKIFF